MLYQNWPGKRNSTIALHWIDGTFRSAGPTRPGMLLPASVALILFALGSTAQAQIEPGFRGSIEYTVLSNGQTWIQTSDPIIVGSYVEDPLIDRSNQPDGRRSIGIVTGTGFDNDYNVMAATVDFGRNYSVGIIFPQLSAIQIVPEPSTLVLLSGAILW